MLAPVCTRRSEEKSPPFRHPGSNQVLPAQSQVPCRLSYLAHTISLDPYVFNIYIWQITSNRTYYSEGYNIYVPSIGIVTL